MSLKPKFRVLGLIILVAQSTGGIAAASPPTNTEAEGNLGAVAEGVAGTLREWWNAGMLNDGVFDVGYTLQADGDRIAHNIDVSLETRIYGMRAS